MRYRPQSAAASKYSRPPIHTTSYISSEESGFESVGFQTDQDTDGIDQLDFISSSRNPSGFAGTSDRIEPTSSHEDETGSLQFISPSPFRIDDFEPDPANEADEEDGVQQSVPPTPAHDSANPQIEVVAEEESPSPPNPEPEPSVPHVCI
jgi:hypothetical protein